VTNVRQVSREIGCWSNRAYTGNGAAIPYLDLATGGTAAVRNVSEEKCADLTGLEDNGDGFTRKGLIRRAAVRAAVAPDLLSLHQHRYQRPLRLLIHHPILHATNGGEIRATELRASIAANCDGATGPARL
jgi:hypothetical protein